MADYALNINGLSFNIGSQMSYLLVSPCRNEAAYMRITLDSVVTQTVKPTLWIIVDDGSSDDTPRILAEYAERYPFIKVITRENRGHRSVGPGVIEAFYHGYDQVDVSQFDYVCKFDLDLDLPPRYFEILIERMQQNRRIGTCSGKAYFRNKKSGELISEKCGDEMSVGMTKFYRRSCFEEIGGFVRQVMWDGIDCHKCRQYGWIAVSWDYSLASDGLKPKRNLYRSYAPWLRSVFYGNQLGIYDRFLYF